MRIPAFICALFSTVALAQVERPPAGVTHNESRLVPVWGSFSSSCVSVRRGYATVVLSREDLESVAGGRSVVGPDSRAPSSEMQVTAATVLNIASGSDVHGCALLTGPDPEWLTMLLGSFLEAGRAAVFDGESVSPQSSITVRYVGMRAGPLMGQGWIWFSVPGKSPFMQSVWWVS